MEGELDALDGAVTGAEVDEVRGCVRTLVRQRAEPGRGGGDPGGMSERTFRRYRDRFEADGAEGLYDRRLGRIPVTVNLITRFRTL